MKKLLCQILVLTCVVLLLNALGWAKEPLFLYQENYFRWFHASGWMGNTNDLAMNSASIENPFAGKTCVKIEYKPKMPNTLGWAGIYWQYPVNNWGTEQGRLNLKGAKKLTLYARGASGGEVVIFRVGGLRGKDFSDTDMAQEKVTLTNAWQQYSINLRDKDLSHIIGGFLVIFENTNNPSGGIIYLDEIQYHR
ncbi:MAG TPA: hypothetical protein PLB05_05300 [Candidatus Omnitrophota bacterium]|nr:hypothetical protein [Candidatus Omnitrophota bacterium]